MDSPSPPGMDIDLRGEDNRGKRVGRRSRSRSGRNHKHDGGDGDGDWVVDSIRALGNAANQQNQIVDRLKADKLRLELEKKQLEDDRKAERKLILHFAKVKYKSDFDSLKVEAENLQRALDESQTARQNLARELDDARSHLTEATGRLDELNAEMDGMRIDAIDKSKRIEQFESDIVSKDEEIARWKSEVDAVAARMNDANDDAAALRRKLDVAEKALSHHAMRSSVESGRLNAEMEETNRRLDDVKAECDHLKEENSRLEAAAAARDGERAYAAAVAAFPPPDAATASPTSDAGEGAPDADKVAPAQTKDIAKNYDHDDDITVDTIDSTIGSVKTVDSLRAAIEAPDDAPKSPPAHKNQDAAATERNRVGANYKSRMKWGRRGRAPASPSSSSKSLSEHGITGSPARASHDCYYDDKVLESERRALNLERAAKVHEQVVDKLKSDMVRLAARKKEDDYLYKTKIDRLMEENAQLTLKCTAFEKEFKCINSDNMTASTASTHGSSTISSSEGGSSHDYGGGCARSLDGTVSTTGHGAVTVVVQDDASTTTSSSIVRLDSSYVNELKSSAESKQKEVDSLEGQVKVFRENEAFLKKEIAELKAEKERLAVLMNEQIDSIEDDKRMVEDELQTKLVCREETIVTLERSLKQLRKEGLSKGGGSVGRRKRKKKTKAPTSDSEKSWGGNAFDLASIVSSQQPLAPVIET